MRQGQYETDPVDGFLLSASQLYLPTSFRASAFAQMETLRKAKGYGPRVYLVPEQIIQPIPAQSQVEYQVRVQVGSYLWGMNLSVTAGSISNLTAMVTDACSEMPLFSDYVNGQNLTPVPSGVSRNPALTMCRPIGEPGTLNVEIYNSSVEDCTCQLALFVAEPCNPTGTIREIFRTERGKVRKL